LQFETFIGLIPTSRFGFVGLPLNWNGGGIVVSYRLGTETVMQGTSPQIGLVITLNGDFNAAPSPA